MTQFIPAATAPTRRPGLAVFFALIPLPLNFVLNNVLAGITADEGVSLAITVAQLVLALALETTAIVLAARVISERKKLRAPTSGTAILAIVLAIIVTVFMVSATVLYYVLAASGITV